MARLIVSNTGPIITLEKLSDGFDFIRKLYDSVLLPTEVLRELAEGTHLVHSTYLRSYKIDDLVQVGRVTRILDVPGMNKLDKGEQEAISLAYDLSLPLLIEETVGRQVALSLGLSISGIAGQIIKAYKEKLIERATAYSMLQELLSSGRINRKIFDSLRNELQ